ncbi:hypothetical protein, partial [Acidovorax sp.]|uniref:hypothetical protein n=1 Tax=Acidovorax sp. TaxID=1872122 RepID=UPI0025BD381D
MLTNEQIDAEVFARWGDMKGAPLAMCRGFALAIEAEVRKDDEALIGQMLEALENHDGNYKLSKSMGAAVDAAITAARARLLDSDLSNLTERGAAAWAGVDAQKLREGLVTPGGGPPGAHNGPARARRGKAP